ncbi:hypothetical protein D3C85_1640920 [compost metagenome]
MLKGDIPCLTCLRLRPKSFVLKRHAFNDQWDIPRLAKRLAVGHPFIGIRTKPMMNMNGADLDIGLLFTPQHQAM